MSIYFISCKIPLNAAQLENIAFHCLYVSTVLVHHMCSVANQVQACDMYHLCVTCVHWQLCARKNCVQQCVCLPIFKVLHTVNVQYTCVY